MFFRVKYTQVKYAVIVSDEIDEITCEKRRYTGFWDKKIS